MKNCAGYVRPSHRFWFPLFRFLSFVFSRVFLGFRCSDRCRIPAGKPVIVLSNHQTDEDPFCILPSFNKPLYPVAADSIFAGRAANRILNWFSVIPKKKGASDVGTVMKIYKLLKNGASVLLFPEGNRYYAEFSYHVAPEIAAFIRKTRATIVLYNIHGGSGVSPRFAAGKRRGRFYGEIASVLPYEEYQNLDDDALYRRIVDGIRVFDSESGEKYKSRRRAEYLERMFFCCPACRSFQTLYSRKTLLICRECGMRAAYGEDLRLRGPAGFERLIDWWDFQKKAVREMPVRPGEEIFRDEDVKLLSITPGEAKKRLDKGTLTLNDTELRCGSHVFPLSEIASASVVSGRNVTFVCEGCDYMLRGNKRFNPVKYAFAFNRLDTAMRRSQTDKYFHPET